jgi:hypothetical protein
VLSWRERAQLVDAFRRSKRALRDSIRSRNNELPGNVFKATPGAGIGDDNGTGVVISRDCRARGIDVFVVSHKTQFDITIRWASIAPN